jgi:hypothetical protein
VGLSLNSLRLRDRQDANFGDRRTCWIKARCMAGFYHPRYFKGRLEKDSYLEQGKAFALFIGVFRISCLGYWLAL